MRKRKMKNIAKASHGEGSNYCVHHYSQTNPFTTYTYTNNQYLYAL